MTDCRRIRVLNVVGRMDRGGVETWLMRVLRKIDRSRFVLDFLVHTDSPAAYDEEIRSLGSRIIKLPSPTPGLRYASRFADAIRIEPRYDVVHSHVHHFSGIVLRAAYRAGVQARIAHSHSDTSAVQTDATVHRRLYLAVAKRLIHRYGTIGLAASGKAGEALFLRREDARCRWRVLHCGVDLDLFRQAVDPIAVRRELGIAANALVVGHVGSFGVPKNHKQLINSFAEVARLSRDAVLLLVGSGPLRSTAEAQIAALGIADRVVFAGSRDDVPRLLAGAVDVFAFPSLWEGLPVAVIEAQAAGLPIVLSDRVSEEVDVVPRLVRRLSPAESAWRWAKTIVEAAGQTRNEDAWRIVQSTDFSIDESVSALGLVYETEFELNCHNRSAA